MRLGADTTLPYERARAVLRTRLFLQQLLGDTALPHELRDEARALLRHYPENFHLEAIGEIEKRLCGLKTDDQQLALLLSGSPRFSPSEE
ncbi:MULTISPECIES: BPSL0761 family protein [Pseudomonas]|uniref:BPSL0761 family protein n=1 Tax=Pseudomonas TaxID=286 RepID=UPI001239784F|nr:MULTISPECIES: BPSL0761 family protein [Pseudomonas]QIB51423.1 hypothetical protein G3M63_10430 [Pseudomonas sp. OIL-1]